MEVLQVNEGSTNGIRYEKYSLNLLTVYATHKTIHKASLNSVHNKCKDQETQRRYRELLELVAQNSKLNEELLEQAEKRALDIIYRTRKDGEMFDLLESKWRVNLRPIFRCPLSIGWRRNNSSIPGAC